MEKLYISVLLIWCFATLVMYIFDRRDKEVAIHCFCSFVVMFILGLIFTPQLFSTF